MISRLTVSLVAVASSSPDAVLGRALADRPEATIAQPRLLEGPRSRGRHEQSSTQVAQPQCWAKKAPESGPCFLVIQVR